MRSTESVIAQWRNLFSISLAANLSLVVVHYCMLDFLAAVITSTILMIGYLVWHKKNDSDWEGMILHLRGPILKGCIEEEEYEHDR